MQGGASVGPAKESICRPGGGLLLSGAEVIAGGGAGPCHTEEWVNRRRPSHRSHESKEASSRADLELCPARLREGHGAQRTMPLLEGGGRLLLERLPAQAEHPVPEGARERAGRPPCSAITVTFEAPARRRLRWIKQYLVP